MILFKASQYIQLKNPPEGVLRSVEQERKRMFNLKNDKNEKYYKRKR